MSIPICPKCNKPTKRTSHGGETTLNYYQPIYDENGVNINPDRNTVTTEWECLACNHVWKEKTRNGEFK